MKKILIASNIAWASVFLFMAYTRPSGNGVKDHETYNDKTNSIEVAANCGEDSYKGLKLKQLLWGLARYRQTHWDSINALQYMQTQGIDDARSCWYSLDTLKRYICFIESNASILKIPTDSLGLRFYYATYADNVSWNPEYKSRHTLFITPTYRYRYASSNQAQPGDSIDANIDFDIRYSAKKAKNSTDPHPHRYTFQELYYIDPNLQVFCLDASTANNLNGMARTAAARNEGQLCPPTCNPPIATSYVLSNQQLFSYANWHVSNDTTDNLLHFVDTQWPRGIGWKDPK